jgi:hypothetical protein
MVKFFYPAEALNIGFQEFSDFPNVVSDSSFHCGGNAQGLPVRCAITQKD